MNGNILKQMCSKCYQVKNEVFVSCPRTHRRGRAKPVIELPISDWSTTLLYHWAHDLIQLQPFKQSEEVWIVVHVYYEVFIQSIILILCNSVHSGHMTSIASVHPGEGSSSVALLKVFPFFPQESFFLFPWSFSWSDVRSWDRDVVCVQIVKPSEENLGYWAIQNKLNWIDLYYRIDQGSGTYGSSSDGIWLPDNFELRKKKSPPATL